MIRARLTQSPLDPSALLAGFLDGTGAGDGAVVTFLGLARGTDKQGSRVRTLLLEHHPRLTQPSLEEIARAGEQRFAVSALDVVHRWGAILPGEPIVWVAVAARHRRSAFEAVDYLMDRLKTEAMFWKREMTGEGSAWIEPTEADRADRARWE